ncbi:hypothetical protein [Azospirillum sp. TSH100]|uniref:hypothetical protein n=1 Tax=Azospirillum sp. TSH100 TaxID=652764 RepID=UPI000D6442D1|nr:hypothetical protein [Azospirillum sp. TSH100]QCG91047.1 hypothetical protein E6C72_25170 [Azospirillum sp. TSH100]
MTGAVLAFALLALADPVVPAWSQQSQQTPAGVATLPPALRAAFLAGNAQQIAAVISTLSNGSPTQAASLSAALLSVAESTLATDPTRAIQAAAAAVQTVRATPVVTSAPQQTEMVLTQASRIFVAPGVQRAAPELSASVATAAIAVAATTGNPVLVANVSVSAMKVAEAVLAVSPAAAVQIASQATQAVGVSAAVQQSAPQQVMDVAISAARIIVNPDAQRVAPQAVGTIAGTVATVVTNPAVYQSAPAAAIRVMADSYATVKSPQVTAADPSLSVSVVRAITDASKDTRLSQINASNGAETNAILAGTAVAQQPITQTNTQTPQVTNPTNDGLIVVNNASPS